MGLWQRLRGVEHRQEGSYTDALVSLIQSRVGGASASVGSTAALEAASGFTARAFASADVTTADSTMAGVLDPSTLGQIGRALIRNGEYLAVIKMGLQDDFPRLAPAASWDVSGNEDPKSWTYRVSLAGPGVQSAFENLPAAAVVHIMYASDMVAPWRGVGPLQSARLAGRLSAKVSAALADELSGPRGALLPLPNVDGNDPAVDALKADIRGLGGGLAFVESQADSFGAGPVGNASAGWDTRRIGASIPPSSIQAAELAFAEVIAACGLSVALWDSSPGTGKREAYRQSLHSVIAPLGQIVAAELTAKLETDVQLDWTELRAGDISGRARAMASMVKAGMDLTKAMALSGLMVSDE